MCDSNNFFFRPNEDALSTLVNRGVTPNEFLIIDLIFIEKPFRLNFRFGLWL